LKKQVFKMEGLSIEVLERIVRKLDPISMCRLASMSVHMRRAFHSYCSSHLRYLANQDSTTEASLEASGWEAGNDHDIWECQCIYLVVGPWYTWGKLTKGKRRKKEVIVEQDHNLQVGAGCVVIKNKLLTCPNASSVAARTRDLLTEVAEVTRFSDFPEYPTFPLYLTNFENTLVVKSIKTEEGFIHGDYTISVYDTESLHKVCDINIMADAMDTKDQSDLEVSNIKMCRNRIAIHLLFSQTPEKNVTQIWAVDTQNPKKETIFLAATVSHPFSVCGALDPGHLALNSRYLLRIGTPDKSNNSTDNLVQYFDMQRLQGNDKGVNYTPVKDPGMIDHQKINVRHVSIIPGGGSILCLGLELDISHRNSHHSYQVVVQLFDLSTQKILAQKDLGSCNHIEDKLKLCWWTENLGLLVRESSSSASLYTWSPGQGEILETGVKLPVGNIHWAFEYFHMDYQGMVTAKVNFGNETTVFQCFKYESEVDGKKKILPMRSKENSV